MTTHPRQATPTGTAGGTPHPASTGYGERADPGVRRWYEDALGWPVTGRPPELVTGVRFDALRLPAEAGLPLLARMPASATGPALRADADIWLLVAEGMAAETPGLLQWLEWGALATELGLWAVGPGGRVPAPAREAGDGSPQTATWLRPPTPRPEGGHALPDLVVGGHTRAPDLVRLVDAAATECHRARLRRTRVTAAAAGAGQPFAFS